MLGGIQCVMPTAPLLRARMGTTCTTKVAPRWKLEPRGGRHTPGVHVCGHKCALSKCGHHYSWQALLPSACCSSCWLCAAAVLLGCSATVASGVLLSGVGGCSCHGHSLCRGVHAEPVPVVGGSISPMPTVKVNSSVSCTCEIHKLAPGMICKGC